MLSQQDNDYISRVGPGTPMGALMREYWVPAMVSTELPHPDCDPVRVMLLGEQLIAFRDTSGKVGMLQNLCPHRGASLFFGRNEEGGLRCVYHGWKFDTTGQCVDMPNEPAESNFKTKIKATAYPCVERGGLVWAYLGPREVPPPLSDLEATMLPEGEYRVTATLRDCNWLQSLEGDIDTSHLGFLHLGALDPQEQTDGTFNYYTVNDRAPRYVAIDTDFGSMYGAYRPAGPGRVYWRIAEFLFPFYTHIPTGILGHEVRHRAWVPMDDSHTLVLSMSAVTRNTGSRNGTGRGDPYLPNTTDWFGRFRLEANASNDFLLDRDKQRSGSSFTGLPSIYLEDQGITESMGATLDRTQEHLGSSDAMVIRTRQRLLEAARALENHKVVPPGVDTPEVFGIRSGGVFLPEGVDWLEGIKDLLPAHVDHPELDLTIT